MPAAQALEAFLASIPQPVAAAVADAVVLADRQSRNWVGPGLLGLIVIVLLFKPSGLFGITIVTRV